jgi:hypothetical protein
MKKGFTNKLKINKRNIKKKVYLTKNVKKAYVNRMKRQKVL